MNVGLLVACLVDQVGPRRWVASVLYSMPRTFPTILGWLVNRYPRVLRPPATCGEEIVAARTLYGGGFSQMDVKIKVQV